MKREYVLNLMTLGLRGAELIQARIFLRVHVVMEGFMYMGRGSIPPTSKDCTATSISVSRKKK